MSNKMKNEKTYVLYLTRYCAQEDFSIAVCMDKSIKRLQYPFCLKDYENSKQMCSISKNRSDSKIVACGSDLYVRSKSKQGCFFEKYFAFSKNLIILPSTLDKRSGFCVCSFMQNIYVMGGNKTVSRPYGYIYSSCNACMCYNVRTKTWTYIASMSESRHNASCAIFEGKIVVSGGRSFELFGRSSFLRSVEMYCSFGNKWTKFPDMLGGRVDHGSVSMGNKLFVVGGLNLTCCEVFDRSNNAFTYVESIPHNTYVNHHPADLVSVGYKIYVIREIQTETLGDSKGKYSLIMLCYDSNKNAWKTADGYSLQNEAEFSCAKVLNN